MNEYENIEAYILKINEVTNAIKGLEEKIKDSIIMKKVLRSLSQRFDSKVFVIEEAKDLNTFNMDEMHDYLIAYEMRIGKRKSIDREANFKAKTKPKAMPEFDEDKTSKELEVNFIHKLKKETKGKYKGKLPFKYFNYGDVRNFATKCPHNERKKMIKACIEREVARR